MHSFLHTLLVTVIVLSALPTIGGVLVLVAVEPKPVTVMDHCRGLARYLILGGCLFQLARLAGGGHAQWEVGLIMLGLAFGVAVHARHNHLLAKLKKKLDNADVTRSL